MKKTTKKLQLAKETVLELGNNDYKQVLGALLESLKCPETYAC
jgi:hypothetical protein